MRLIFDKFDTNNDGRIGYAQFLRFIEAGHPELGQQQQLATGLMTPIAVSSNAGPATMKGAIRSEALERLRYDRFAQARHRRGTGRAARRARGRRPRGQGAAPARPAAPAPCG